MDAATFASASGLRPMSAFVVIGGVLTAVAAWVPWLAWDRAAEQPDRVQVETSATAACTIVDRGGRVIATSVPRFDVHMSPRSMWQGHTPDHMARRIGELLGVPPAELLARFLPDAVDGWVDVPDLVLTPAQAVRLAEWVDAEPPLSGVRFASGEDGLFRLSWSPALLLSAAARESRGYRGPGTWTRRIADRVLAALEGPAAEGAVPRTAEELQALRAEVWSRLLPAAFAVPLEGIPGHLALAFRELLREEGVSPWQMSLAYGSERRYPAGREELFGVWGYPDAEATEPEPRSGLELAASRIVAGTELDLRPGAYSWSRDRNVRGARADGFLAYAPGSAPPRVESTLDLGLQHFAGVVLERVMEEHRPAVAMAIAVDVASGDVLALDSREAFEIAPFPPIYHAFTPGSTFKMVTMAVALEEGAVRPDTTFDVGPVDHYVLVCEEPLANGRTRRTTRVIHEAEGSRGGVLHASECLAWSVNAGLVQIGLRVDDEVFRDYLVRLGYDSAPGSGLGIEKRGSLTPLPWSRTYTHASVSFGHELTTTLWQHASALTTIVRGGVLRPLRLFSGVEASGRRVALELAGGERVFSEGTCSELRAMMRLGAAEGTGASVIPRMVDRPEWRAAAEALAESGVVLATKTGTAEKVPSEVCLHVELAARRSWREAGVTPTRAMYRALRSAPQPHRSCYTSSMCAFARSPETGRELLVLVVVDEPCGRERFGSKVAGPAAFALLAEGLGLTRGGERTGPVLDDGFVPAGADGLLAEAGGGS